MGIHRDEEDNACTRQPSFAGCLRVGKKEEEVFG